MIYDDAGYIAGVQSVLLESDVDMSYNDLTKQAGHYFLNVGCNFLKFLPESKRTKDTYKNDDLSQPVYVQDVWMGQTAWFTTAYFVDPLVICNGGRSSNYLYIKYIIK